MRHVETTERIIRCAIDVHKTIGPGHPLDFYIRALVHELELSGVPVRADVPVGVTYRELFLGERRIPIVVDDVVAVMPRESEIGDVAIGEAVAILRASGIHVGLVLNFGRSRLDIRRVAN